VFLMSEVPLYHSLRPSRRKPRRSTRSRRKAPTPSAHTHIPLGALSAHVPATCSLSAPRRRATSCRCLRGETRLRGRALRGPASTKFPQTDRGLTCTPPPLTATFSQNAAWGQEQATWKNTAAGPRSAPWPRRRASTSTASTSKARRPNRAIWLSSQPGGSNSSTSKARRHNRVIWLTSQPGGTTSKARRHNRVIWQPGGSNSSTSKARRPPRRVSAIRGAPSRWKEMVFPAPSRWEDRLTPPPPLADCTPPPLPTCLRRTPRRSPMHHRRGKRCLLQGYLAHKKALPPTPQRSPPWR